MFYIPFKFEEVTRPTVVKNAAFCVTIKELDPVDSRLPKIVILQSFLKKRPFYRVESPEMIFAAVYFIMPSMSRVFSPINLPLRKPVWS